VCETGTALESAMQLQSGDADPACSASSDLILTLRFMAAGALLLLTDSRSPGVFGEIGVELPR